LDLLQKGWKILNFGFCNGIVLEVGLRRLRSQDCRDPETDKILSYHQSITALLTLVDIGDQIRI
jgi:hypothetical protein